MTNLILIVVLLLILGGAALYVYTGKKRGTNCIGCPHAKSCNKRDCDR